jgi:hypothetical protein
MLVGGCAWELSGRKKQRKKKSHKLRGSRGICSYLSDVANELLHPPFRCDDDPVDFGGKADVTEFSALRSLVERVRFECQTTKFIP